MGNVLDTSFFIKLTPLNMTDGWKYYTTEFIIKEIRDEKARSFYELNKDFITVKNPARENMHFVTQFAKKSNDLKPLSIPDLSVLALSYELVKENKLKSLIRSEPKLNIVENSKVVKREKKEKEKIEKSEEEKKFAIVEDAQVTTMDMNVD